MKKIIVYIAMQLTAAICITATAATYTKGQTIKARTVEGIEISFTVLDPDAKTCAIKGYCIDSNTSGKVTVPNYADGYKVVEANSYAFSSCKKITSVVLPSALTKLNYRTFSSCDALTEVSLPNELTDLGTYTFYNCKKLKSISIPSKVTSIGRSSFSSCEKLESVKFANAIDSIYENAFAYCESLESIALPTTVKVINDWAFYRCSNLKTITGFANVEYLGEYVFSNTAWYDKLPEGELIYIGKVAYLFKGTMPENTKIAIKDGTTSIASSAISNANLVSVSIPASVKNIGQSAFGYHSGLSSISVSSANRNYDSRGNCDAIIHTATNTLVTGCNNTVIPPTVSAIGYGAFSGSRITEVTIPDAVDSLANYAFSGCSKLKFITIGRGLKIIGNWAFSGCGDLENISVSSSNPYFDSRSNCNGIIEKSTNTLVVGCMTTAIPNTVKNIGNYAYCACENASMYSFTIPNHIEEVGEYAFAYNDNLRAITIGRNVKTIGKNAFYECEKLMAVRMLSDTPFEIDRNVYELWSQKRDSLYNHATLIVPVGSRINYQGTAGWSEFQHIVEADPSTLIEDEVFTSKTIEGHLLTYQVTSSSRKTCALIGSPKDINGTVTIPEQVNGFTVTSIAEEAFYSYQNDRNITALSLPNSIIDIGAYAFYSSKARITSLPNSLETVGNSAFSQCNLSISSLPLSLKHIGNWAFGQNETSELHIPASVESIGFAAFSGWKNLSKITVDEGNKIYTSPVGSNAIVKKDTKTLVFGCRKTVIPSDVVCVGEYAFYRYKHDESATIIIPESVSTIERYAFAYSGLSEITLPESVKIIGENAFRACGKLVSITSNNTNPVAIPDNVFEPGADQEDTYKKACLYVPAGCKTAYQTTDGWKKFNHIEEYQILVSTVNDVDYELNQSTKTATVKLIHADHADVIIPEEIDYEGNTYGVTSIADSVFCSDTEAFIFSVTFPATIKQVSHKAFWRYNPSAIVWNSSTKIPEGSFDNIFYQGCNFLLYVNDAAVAPADVENLIVNGRCNEVVLQEYWQFNCPQEFTAAKISLTHNYTMQTGLGSSAGWETITLPFDVTSITHESKGQLVPFAVYQEGSDSKPFWLYNLTSNGFVKAAAIKANTPYIISMPNNEGYAARYNIPGKVTFAATNAKVHRTGDDYQNIASYDGGTFRPCYSFYLNNANIYALNVPNDMNTSIGTDAPGSVFLNDGNMIIYPFGARIEKSSSGPNYKIVFSGDDTDDIQDLYFNESRYDELVKVYNLSGQLVGTFNKVALSGSEKQLPSGVYVINGKKVIVK